MEEQLKEIKKLVNYIGFIITVGFIIIIGGFAIILDGQEVEVTNFPKQEVRVDTVYVKNIVVTLPHPDYPQDVNLSGINGYTPACYWASENKEVVNLGVK